MADSEPGENTLEITLTGYPEPVVLTCTSKVALALCAEPGGLEAPAPREGQTFAPPSTVTSRLLALDIPTMAKIIRLGCGVGPSAVKELEDQIFQTGLFDVMFQLAPFLGMVKNGGKRPKPAGDGEGGEDGGDAAGTENPPAP